MNGEMKSTRDLFLDSRSRITNEIIDVWFERLALVHKLDSGRWWRPKPLLQFQLLRVDRRLQRLRRRREQLTHTHASNPDAIAPRCGSRGGLS